jgi:hypothetical protein
VISEDVDNIFQALKALLSIQAENWANVGMGFENSISNKSLELRKAIKAIYT